MFVKVLLYNKPLIIYFSVVCVIIGYNRPFLHYKFPCSLRALGMTKSIRTGASGSKCTRCIWTSESVITIKYRLFLAFSIVNC